MNFPYEVEIKLTEALDAENRGEFYGIDADSAHNTEGVWKMTWATLTAVQLNNPKKRERIHNFLEEYYEFVSENKQEYEIPGETKKKFLADLDRILEVNPL